MRGDSVKVPGSVRLEASVLGWAILKGGDVARRVLDLDRRLFHDPAHVFILSTMEAMEREGDAIEFLSILDRLESGGNLERIGGYDYLDGLQKAAAGSVEQESAIRSLTSYAQKRETIAACRSTAAAAMLPDATASDTLDGIDQALAEIRALDQRRRFFSMAEASKDLREHQKQARERAREQGAAGAPIGLHALAKRLKSFYPGRLYILAARPSVGKTALALQLAIFMARQGNPVVYWIGEMDARELFARGIQQATGKPSDDIIAGTIGLFGNQDELLRAWEELEQLPLYIDDTPAASLAVLESRIRAVQSKHPGKMVTCFADYLQRMKLPRAEQLRISVGMGSTGLKTMARDLSVPIVALSQLNRGIEGTKRRPNMGDLKESGDVEQDADVIIAAHAPEGPENKARELGIIKNRHGAAGWSEVDFRPERVSFYDDDDDF